MRCCSCFCCRRTVLVFFAITCYIKAAKSLLRLCVAYFSFLSLLSVTALETTTTTVLEVFVTTPSTSFDDDNGDTFLRLLLPSSFKSNNTPRTRCFPRHYLRDLFLRKSVQERKIPSENWHLRYAFRVSALRQFHTQCDAHQNALFPLTQGWSSLCTTTI